MATWMSLFELFVAKKRALKGLFIRLFAWYVPLQIPFASDWAETFCRLFRPSILKDGSVDIFWPLTGLLLVSSLRLTMWREGLFDFASATRCCACNKMPRTLATSGVSSIQKKTMTQWHDVFSVPGVNYGCVSK